MIGAIAHIVDSRSLSLELLAHVSVERFDLGFAEMQEDPIGAVERLYEEMGDELTPATRERMQAWWRDSGRERRRGPPPDPRTYGLDLDAVRDQFAFYHDRFGVPTG